MLHKKTHAKTTLKVIAMILFCFCVHFIGVDDTILIVAFYSAHVRNSDASGYKPNDIRNPDLLKI